MSIRVTDLVWTHAPYSEGTLLVLLALADWSNDDGESWPKLPQLMAKSRQSRRNILYILKRLEDDGMITRMIGRGRGHQNSYRIDLDKLSTAKGAKVQPLHLSEETPQVPEIEEKSTEKVQKVQPLHLSQKVQLATLKGASSDTFPVPPSSSPPYPPNNSPFKGNKKEPSGETRARPKSEKSTTAKPHRTPCPQSYTPTETQVAYATEHRIDLATEIHHFLSHHRSHGKAFVDWAAAFWTWLHNHERFGVKPNTPAKIPQPQPPAEESMAEREWKAAYDRMMAGLQRGVP